MVVGGVHNDQPDVRPVEPLHRRRRRLLQRGISAIPGYLEPHDPAVLLPGSTTEPQRQAREASGYSFNSEYAV